MADLTLAATDGDTVYGEMIADYKARTGKTLAPGDPRAMVLRVVAYFIAQARTLVDFGAKQSLIRYVADPFIEELGKLTGVTRNPAEPSEVTVRFTFDVATRTVAAGKRVSDGTHLWAARDTVTGSMLVDYVDVVCVCTVAGPDSNGVAVGFINTAVDDIPGLISCVNTTESAGGTTVEPIEAYRARIMTAAEETSTCGNRLAYEAAAEAASPSVIDARAIGPNDGAYTVGSAPSAGGVYLCIIKGSRDPEGNVISAEPEPDSGLISLVNAALQDDQVKKLTDSLTVKAPAYYDISPSVTYYIAKSRSGYVDEIKAAVEKAFDDWCVWQQAKIGRDVNPSKLTADLVNAGAKRTLVSAPAYHAIHIDEVTRVGYCILSYGGLEDD